MSSIYYKGQKYTGPTLDLGSGSLTTDDKTIVGAINELDAKIDTVVANAVPLSSSTEYISGYESFRSGNVVQIKFNATSIPSSSWTDLGYVSKIPTMDIYMPCINGSVTGYGTCNLNTLGRLRIYHTNSDASSFYGVVITYLTND